MPRFPGCQYLFLKIVQKLIALRLNGMFVAQKDVGETVKRNRFIFFLQMQVAADNEHPGFTKRICLFLFA